MKMNWKFWEWFRKNEPEPEPEPYSYPEIEYEDAWQLAIEMCDNRSQQYSNLHFRELWKPYKWFLTKDSPKYNMLFKDGMRIITRNEIMSMDLRKIKRIKENNDESET